MFLKEHHIESYIKLQEYEQRKPRAYKVPIIDEDTFIFCALKY